MPTPGEGGAEEGGRVRGPCTQLVPTRIWKLTPDQYTSTVRAMVPWADRPGDGIRSSLSFGTQRLGRSALALEMTEAHLDQLFEAALLLSEEALSDPGRLFPCLGRDLTDRSCIRSFIEDFGHKALRRPLRTEEANRYLGFFEKEALKHGPFPALRLFIRVLLLTPEFLFRTELGPELLGDGGPPVVTLTPFERASALSYLLLDGPPDPALYTAARDDQLDAPQIEAQVRRLLLQPDQARGVFAFFEEYLRLGDVPNLRKTRDIYPDFSAQVAADLAEETRQFIRQVLWKDDARLRTLLTAGYSVVNDRLADFYGVPRPLGSAFAKVDFQKGQRVGLLTQGSLMAAMATESDTRPVERGKFIRERLLCQHLPPPPPMVRPVVPPSGGKLTGRERLAQHTSDRSCAGCHDLMDPLGFALEPWNAVGKYRTTEYGKPIDPAGQLLSVRDQPVRFSGAEELFGHFGGEAQVSECFVKNMYEYVHGEPVPATCPEGAAVLSPLLSQFAGSQGNVIDLFVHMTTAPGYFLRWTGERGGP